MFLQADYNTGTSKINVNSLTDADVRMLERSFIPCDLAIDAGIERVDSIRGAELAGRMARGVVDYSGLVFPYVWPGDSRPREYRLRRDHPDLEASTNGGPPKEKGKYLSPPGRGNLLYFAPGTPPEDLADHTIPIYITEGEKKTLALHQFNRTRGNRVLAVGLAGAWNWKGIVGKTADDDGKRQDVKGPIPDLDRIEWAGRRVTIIFDSNVATNDSVRKSRNDLRRELTRRGALIYFVDLPNVEHVNGVDDLLYVKGADFVATLIEQATTGDPQGRRYPASEFQDMVPLAAAVFEDLAGVELANPIIFWSGGVLARVHPQSDRVKIEQLTIDLMSYRLSHLGKWITERKDKRTGERIESLRTPPVKLIRHMMAAPMPETPFPVLKGTVTAPVFTSDGELITSPGFHPASGLYYLKTFEAAPLPDIITDGDVEDARRLIEDELLIDFPFATDADKHNAIGLMLLPFVREIIGAGCTPLHLIEASVPGSGKGLLTHSLLYAALGEDGVMSVSQPDSEAEMSKVITAALTAGKGTVLFDNLRDTLDSAVLAAALTSTVWNNRVLGTNRNADAPIRCCWVATGNNPTLSAENARRCVRIRLEPQTDRPEDRENFKHKVLKNWIIENRAELVRACHVLILNWLQNGKPAHSGRPFGSYEQYADVIGGILQAAGFDQFRANEDEFRERASSERGARAELCNEWYEWAVRERRTLGASASEIWEIARSIEGLPLQGVGDEGLKRSFGRYLAGNVGVVADFYDPESGTNRTFKMLKGKTRKGRQLWSVDCIRDLSK